MAVSRKSLAGLLKSRFDGLLLRLTNVHRTPSRGQLNLPLSLFESCPTYVFVFIDARRAADTLLEVWRIQVLSEHNLANGNAGHRVMGMRRNDIG